MSPVSAKQSTPALASKNFNAIWKGLDRFSELSELCGRNPSVPSIILNGRIAFDNIPDMDSLTKAVHQALDSMPSGMNPKS